MMLENPGLPGQSRITHSLFAGLQIILPGEIAPAHRHVASALRFIIEGKDAYTAVAGEKTYMLPGDFVITPSMTWHDHGNDGNGPMVWLDGLDVPIVNLMDASFRDGYPEPHPPGDAARGRGRRRIRLQHAADGPGTRLADLADLQLSLCAHARGAGEAPPLPPARSLPRLQDEIHQPGRPAAGRCRRSRPGCSFCPRASRPGPIARPTAPSSPWSRGKAPASSAARASPGSRTTSSSCRAGISSSTRPRDDAVLFGFSDRVCQEKLDFFREQRGNA